MGIVVNETANDVDLVLLYLVQQVLRFRSQVDDLVLVENLRETLFVEVDLNGGQIK